MPPVRALVFLLSPASLRGVRGSRILGEDPGPTLRSGGAVPLGDVYAHISSLYYRGKRAYARTFGVRPAGDPVLAITPTRGLMPDREPVDLETLATFARTPIDPAEPAYLESLLGTARALEEELTRLDAGAVAGEPFPGPSCVVLLGSIATGKYLDPLVQVFGRRLLIPRDFVGRGDMSRGGLLLRAARTGTELGLVPAVDAPRSGPRPPRLGPA